MNVGYCTRCQALERELALAEDARVESNLALARSERELDEAKEKLDAISNTLNLWPKCDPVLAVENTEKARVRSEKRCKEQRELLTQAEKAIEGHIHELVCQDEDDHDDGCPNAFGDSLLRRIRAALAPDGDDRGYPSTGKPPSSEP